MLIYNEAEHVDPPSICESREAAVLATELLSWGPWSGADFDFLTRVEAMTENDPDMIDIVQEMHATRQRERNLNR